MRKQSSEIISKDEALESTLIKFQSAIKNLGFELEARDWLNPIPNVWSVNLHDKDCRLLFSSGHGRSKKTALLSAYGEFIEHLSCNHFFADFYFGEEISNADFVHYPNERWFESGNQLHPELLADEKLIEFYFPEQHGTPPTLIDFNSGNQNRGVCALPFVQTSNNKTVWFPVNVIDNLYGSNGMAVGDNLIEARVHALSETLERAIKFRIIVEKICIPNIPDIVIERYPSIQQSIDALRELGYGVLVKDASLGGVYPVVNVTLLNHQDQGCYASFGAHPKFEVALERALTELLQGRTSDTLKGFPLAEFDENEIINPQNIESHFVDSSGCVSWRFLQASPDIAFTEWDFSSNSESEYATLCAIIHDLGHNIYITDFAHLGINACRVIIPGFSEIYPPDDLVWENNNEGLYFRKPILNLNTLTVDQCQNLFDEFIVRGYDDLHPIAQLIGIAPNPNSIWEELNVGELKILLALRTKNTTATLNGCAWIQMAQQISNERLSLYRCIASLIQLGTTDNYAKSLAHLFGVKKIELAEKLISGKAALVEFENHANGLSHFDQHQQLLNTLVKLRHAMT